MSESEIRVCVCVCVCVYTHIYRASLVAQLVKNLFAMQETWVQFLGWEDFPGEGNGNPLQHSCLENPMDRGAWWTARRLWGRTESDTTEVT